MNLLALIAWVSFFLIALLAAGIVTVLIGALIWHCAPNSRAGRWIGEEVIQTVDVSSMKVGDCLKPSQCHRKIGTWKADGIMVGGVMCDE